MDLREKLYDSSKKATMAAAEFLLDNPELADNFMELAFADDKKFSPRAARAFCRACEKRPELVLPYEERIIEYLKTTKNERLIMHFLWLFEVVPVPKDEDLQGWLMKLCFDFINMPSDKTAIKALALSDLYKIVKIYPEVTGELVETIKFHMPHSSAAFQSRGRAILKELNIPYVKSDD